MRRLLLLGAAFCAVGVAAMWAYLVAITPGSWEGKVLGWTLELCVLTSALALAATWPGDLPGDAR